MGGRLLAVAVLLCQLTALSGQTDARAVVLPQSEARSVAKGGGWLPTKEDIAGLEAVLDQVSHLKDENYRAGNLHIDHPEKYFRQYVGIFRGGQKRIYVNAFCDAFPPPPDWRKGLVIILDGGTCVWQADYDPAARKFLTLRINGVG